MANQSNVLQGNVLMFFLECVFKRSAVHGTHQTNTSKTGQTADFEYLPLNVRHIQTHKTY